MVKRIAIIVIVLALLGAAGLGVWAATPLDEILSPTPEPTATALPKPISVLIASGYDACEFTITPPTAGYRLDYGFQTAGSTGKLTELPSDVVLDEVTVTAQQFPLRRPNLVLDAGIKRKFRIESSDNGYWQYAIRPPEGTAVDETFLIQPPESAGSGQSFRLQACRG